jgi:anti-anti-sigma factor
VTSRTSDRYSRPAVVVDLWRPDARQPLDRCCEDLVVSVRGDLDIAAETILVETVRAAIAERSPARVALDLSAVAFLDARGVAAILGCRQAAHAADAAFALTRTSRQVQHLLRLLAVHDLLPPLSDPADHLRERASVG